MKKKNRLMPLALVSIVVLVAVLVAGKKLGWFGSELTINVLAQNSELRTITEQITANGKIQPKTEVKISPDVSGEIIELFVEEGDQVKPGDPLMVIKPDLYITALNRAEAALNSAKARLMQAEAQHIERELAFNRARQLFSTQTIPQSEFESAQAGIRIAEAEVRAAQYSVKSAEANVAEAQEQLTKTRVYAPLAGTISRLNVEKGERVVGTGMYAGTETMVVANLDWMEVRVDVNENDIVKVSLGDTALVQVDAYLNRKFKGVVTEIANSARVTGVTADQVTNFEVKILLLQESYLDLIDSVRAIRYPFRPGMSATVDILTRTRYNVVTVPVQAVTSRVVAQPGDSATVGVLPSAQEEKEEVVFRIEGGRARKVVVKSGVQDKSFIEITEGLEAGEEIIIGPYNAVSRTLSDSINVKVVTEAELFKVTKN